ncbi:KR domain-containing protein, partial [Vibrio vulnificus]|nr:KR domain-containing protein [Vibrio vulnificus]
RHGVFHLAGVIHEALITDQSAAELRAVYEPKVRGLERLGDLLLERHPDAFLVAFASARSLAPGTTVSGYVSASDFAAHHAALLRSRGLAATSVAWGVWDETGMSRDLRVNRSLSRRGNGPAAGAAGAGPGRRHRRARRPPGRGRGPAARRAARPRGPARSGRGVRGHRLRHLRGPVRRARRRDRRRAADRPRRPARAVRAP